MCQPSGSPCAASPGGTVIYADDRCDCRCRAVNRCFVSGPLKREYFAYLSRECERPLLMLRLGLVQLGQGIIRQTGRWRADRYPVPWLSWVRRSLNRRIIGMTAVLPWVLFGVIPIRITVASGAFWWITVSKARIPTTMSSARASIWSDGGGVRPTLLAPGRSRRTLGGRRRVPHSPADKVEIDAALGGLLHQLRMGDLRIPVRAGHRLIGACRRGIGNCGRLGQQRRQGTDGDPEAEPDRLGATHRRQFTFRPDCTQSQSRPCLWQ